MKNSSKIQKPKTPFLRNIEIIGEAVKNSSNKLKKKHSEIEWRRITGMRDKLIHFYFRVNLDIVWDIVKNKIPTLRNKISKIVLELK